MRVSPRVAVVVFPGSQDDRDAAWALGSVGAEPVFVWHAEHELPRGTAAIVLPGGFSYGDYLRCGAIARFSPALEAVARFAAEGSLPKLGFPVHGIRVGRLIDLEVECDDPAEARAQVERMCAELLTNPLIESAEIELA